MTRVWMRTPSASGKAHAGEMQHARWTRVRGVQGKWWCVRGIQCEMEVCCARGIRSDALCAMRTPCTRALASALLHRAPARSTCVLKALRSSASSLLGHPSLRLAAARVSWCSQTSSLPGGHRHRCCRRRGACAFDFSPSRLGLCRPRHRACASHPLSGLTWHLSPRGPTRYQPPRSCDPPGQAASGTAPPVLSLQTASDVGPPPPRSRPPHSPPLNPGRHCRLTVVQ
jgi:hypothetical protein